MKPFLLSLIALVFSYNCIISFDKRAYYEAFSNNDDYAINQQIELLSKQNFSEKNGYEGALLMKKSGMINSAKEKLSLFKLGAQKLELAISQNNKNTEFRFLRIVIQENAPKLLNYHKNIKEDALYVTENFKNLPTLVKPFVVNYSKKSLVLKPSDLE